MQASVPVMRFLENPRQADDAYNVLERSLGRTGVRNVRIDELFEVRSIVGL